MDGTTKAVVQCTGYQAFGTPFNEGRGENTQRFKYSGKEFDQMHGLNWFDFHARRYDPLLGSFTSMDPLAEMYYSISPYVYCMNNPLKYVDPDGKQTRLPGGNGVIPGLQMHAFQQMYAPKYKPLIQIPKPSAVSKTSGKTVAGGKGTVSKSSSFTTILDGKDKGFRAYDTFEAGVAMENGVSVQEGYSFTFSSSPETFTKESMEGFANALSISGSYNVMGIEVTRSEGVDKSGATITTYGISGSVGATDSKVNVSAGKSYTKETVTSQIINALIDYLLNTKDENK